MKTRASAADVPAPRLRVKVTYRTRLLSNGSQAVDVRWRHEGRAFARAFESMEAAERWGTVLARAGHDAATVLLDKPAAQTVPSVIEAGERYIKTRTKLGEDTAHRYKRYLETSIGPAFGMLPVNIVGREEVTDWVQAQQQAHMASKTIKNRLRFLASVFEFARDEEWLSKNPARKVDIAETLDVEMTFLTVAEFRILLSFIPEQYKALILFLAFTGLRWSEATSLVGGDFDLARRKVSVTKAWKWTPKGYVIGPPKTRRSKREVPFDMELSRVLAPMVKSAGRYGYVFKNSKGGPVRQASFWARTWAPARRLANGQMAHDYTRGPKKNSPWNVVPTATPIDKLPRIHDLRHTHASWLIEKGVAFELIQDRLGHESITTTIDRYGHLDPRRVEETMRATELLSEELRADDYDDD